MLDSGAPMRDAVESARAHEETKAAHCYAMSQRALVESQQDLSQFWQKRVEAMALQVRGDQHAYAENVLSTLLHPPSFQTYHDDHTDDPSFGADGRDAHAS